MSDSARLSDDARQDAVLDAYREVRYNVMSVPFDARTRTFGAPRLEVDCRTMARAERSRASVPTVAICSSRSAISANFISGTRAVISG